MLRDRHKGKQPGDLGNGNTSQKHSHTLLLMRAGVEAVLQLAGKTETGLLLIHKNILSASAFQRVPIPFFIGHHLPAEHIADVGNRVGRKKQIADGKLRINIQLHLKPVVQKQRLRVQLGSQTVIQRIFRIEIRQLILPDGLAQQNSELFVTGVFVGELIHRLRENAAQPDVRLHNRGLRRDQMLGDGIAEQQIGSRVERQKDGGNHAADNQKGAFCDTHRPLSPPIRSETFPPAYRFLYSLGVMPVCFLKNFAKY